ncbi:MAG TPA: prolyl oligopeptidase family serine peptidase, partial [Actinomycetes bacterium]
PGPVLLLGHSAGAHLAALGALATDRFLVGCPYPAVTVDGLVGLAGPYDVTAWAELVQPLFGVPLQGHRDRWAAGDPLAVAATTDRSGFRVLLAHGDIDDLVPTYESRSFAAVLERAGATVTLEIVPGADHDTIYSAATAGPLVARWLAGLSGSAPGAGAETPAR